VPAPAARDYEPERALGPWRIFDESFSGYTGMVAGAVAAGYDFSPFTRLVDVGGGGGLPFDGRQALSERARRQLRSSARCRTRQERHREGRRVPTSVRRRRGRGPAGATHRTRAPHGATFAAMRMPAGATCSQVRQQL
jgi:hypothetical protein